MIFIFFNFNLFTSKQKYDPNEIKSLNVIFDSNKNITNFNRSKTEIDPENYKTSSSRNLSLKNNDNNSTEENLIEIPKKL